MKVRKIISGGQTGVDRAALDFALENGIDTGGYVPRGRRAEDGKIPDTYLNLIETGSNNPVERTELNVLHSDATLIFSRGELNGGSKLTAELAAKHGKFCFHVDLSAANAGKSVREVKDWLDRALPMILNIAGPRASEDKEIYIKTKRFLETLRNYVF